MFVDVDHLSRITQYRPTYYWCEIICLRSLTTLIVGFGLFVWDYLDVHCLFQITENTDYWYGIFCWDFVGIFCMRLFVSDH